MTTNVFDGGKQVVATDSRWSIRWGNRIVYVDDVPFHKIELYKHFAFMFAGLGNVVQSWKDWIRSAPADLSGMPNASGIAVCIINTQTGDVPFSARQDIIKDGGYFAGSGSRDAYRCWSQNRDPLRCVESAKSVDFYTGGEVKFLEFATGRHNLHYPVVNATITMVSEAINNRGEVMNIGTGKANEVPFKLSELAAHDAEARDLQARIASGLVTPEAPCDGMYDEWTPEQTDRLKAALSTVFDIAK